MGSEPDPNVFGIELEESPETRIDNVAGGWLVCDVHRLGGWTRLRDIQLALLAGVMSLRGVSQWSSPALVTVPGGETPPRAK